MGVIEFLFTPQMQTYSIPVIADFVFKVNNIQRTIAMAGWSSDYKFRMSVAPYVAGTATLTYNADPSRRFRTALDPLIYAPSFNNLPLNYLE